MRTAVRLMAAAGVSLAMSWTSAQAVESTFDFALPAQPLHAALQAYSQQTRLSVFYETSVIAGKQSRPVTGTLTAQAGLLTLLGGTGVSARITPQRSFLLYVDPAAAVPSPDQDAAVQRFDLTLRARVVQTLCARPDLQLGRHRVALRLWVDSDGRIGALQVRIAEQPELEARTYAALAGLMIGRLPKGAEEPAVMVLTPESVRRLGGCP
jgi:hypothetical protein